MCVSLTPFLSFCKHSLSFQVACHIYWQPENKITRSILLHSDVNTKLVLFFWLLGFNVQKGIQALEINKMYSAISCQKEQK